MKHKIKIEGMSCGHCVSVIEKALGGVSTVSTVNVDLGTGTVEVHSDATTSIDALNAAVEAAGYKTSEPA